MAHRAKKRKLKREAEPKGLPVTAKLSNLRTSAQKVRLIANQIRGKRVDDVITYLGFSDKRASRPFYKLIESAVANAERYAADVDQLVVSDVQVDGGRTWRIFRPRAQGRATPVIKRTCTIKVKLDQAKKVVKKK